MSDLSMLVAVLGLVLWAALGIIDMGLWAWRKYATNV